MKNEYKYINENTIEITLTQGQKCYIDVGDMELVGEYKWFAHKNHNSQKNYYARYSMPKVDGKRKALLLHRLIIGIDDPEIEIDHIDGNSLNNRRSNLRIATSSENACNQVAHRDSLSGIKNISKRKNSKYQVRIEKNRKEKTYGTFNTKEEAIIRRNEILLLLHKEFANTKDKKR